ncbi:FxLD family lanthipeptide [Streptomyces apricus]|uniref:FxLD family lantipeptide n=1 Tax=Streptomyces apricus TaxID=1828112 RepID=A0A5A9ZX99_9ACTN|nr:FxLD family lanthipeptide [Streptomyces apricus]KAA0921215.1 FxLD family lantipeptide [Streptomyces apricus]
MSSAATLTSVTTATTEASVTTVAPGVPDDPFDVDLTIVTEIGADLLPKACGTGDGCAASCASSCASAV